MHSKVAILIYVQMSLENSTFPYGLIINYTGIKAEANIYCMDNNKVTRVSGSYDSGFTVTVDILPLNSFPFVLKGDV